MSDLIQTFVSSQNQVGGTPVGVDAIPNQITSTTIAAGSNGLTLPQAQIFVASSTGFALASGEVGLVLVTTGAGIQLVTYTGVAAGQLTGTSGGTGLMTTGGAVQAAVFAEATKIMLGGANANGGFVSTTNPMPVGMADTTSTGNLAGAGQTIVIALAGEQSAAFNISAATTLIGTLVPEVSLDGGTTYVTAYFSDPTNVATLVTSLVVASGVAVNRGILLPPGVTHARVRVSAFTSGTAAATLKATLVIPTQMPYAAPNNTAQPPQIVAVGGLAAGNVIGFSLSASGGMILSNGQTIGSAVPGTTAMAGQVDSAGNTRNLAGTASTPVNTEVALIQVPKKLISFEAGIIGLVPAAAATDLFTIVGSATKTVIVTRIRMTGIQTAAGTVDVQIVKRSTANTVGTATNPTRVVKDSNDTAATATINAYTANPTTGTLVGAVRQEKLDLSAAGTVGNIYEVICGTLGDLAKFFILRGVAQTLGINLNGQTIAGGALNVWIEWIEF